MQAKVVKVYSRWRITSKQPHSSIRNSRNEFDHVSEQCGSASTQLFAASSKFSTRSGKKLFPFPVFCTRLLFQCEEEISFPSDKCFLCLKHSFLMLKLKSKLHHLPDFFYVGQMKCYCYLWQLSSFSDVRNSYGTSAAILPPPGLNVMPTSMDKSLSNLGNRHAEFYGGDKAQHKGQQFFLQFVVLYVVTIIWNMMYKLMSCNSFATAYV